MDAVVDLIESCDELFPREDACRTEAMAQYKDRMRYERLARFVTEQQSKDDAESAAFARDVYNPMFMSMRAQAMTEAECNENANRLRNVAVPSQEDLDRAQERRNR